MPHRLRSRTATLAVALIAALLAGCGGGGGTTTVPSGSSGSSGSSSGGSSSSAPSLSVTPNAISFESTAGAPQTFTVTSSATATVDLDACAGIVTLTSNGGGSYTVTPVANGACNLVLIAGTSAATLPVSVSASYSGPETLTASPAVVTFASASAASQAITVNAGQYVNGGSGGTVGIDAGACSGIATASGGGTVPATVTVSPVAAGGCNVVLYAGAAATIVPVSIAQQQTSAAVTLSTTSMTFTSPSSATQSVTIGYQGYVGQVTVNQSSCANVASLQVPNGTLPQTATVSAIAAGSCTITFTPANGTAASLAITVQ